MWDRENSQQHIQKLKFKKYSTKYVIQTFVCEMRTESDENDLAIQKKFQVSGRQSLQPIQCFLGPLIYPY